MWTQNYNPLNNMLLTAVIASIPILVMFYSLAVRKLKGHAAGILTVAAAVIVALFLYSMPLKLTLLSTFNGVLYGLFPIGWMIVTAVYLYNLTVKAGKFDIIKASIASITDDRRLQALLIAFGFGAFLEAASGFGTPVAIAGAILVGLGFSPLYAAGLALIANTAPVAFGGIGIPVLVAGQVSGLDAYAISKVLALQLPVLAFLIPFWIVIIMSGMRGVVETLPAILVSGLSFALAQGLTAYYLGPMLPNIIASLVNIIAMAVLLKFWQPKKPWRFPNERETKISQARTYPLSEVLQAWAPFILLTAFIILWSFAPVKKLLEMATLSFAMPGLHEVILKSMPIVQQPEPYQAIYKLNWLSSPGTAILIAAFVSLPVLGMSLGEGIKVFFQTVNQLKYPLVSIAAILGFAYLANYSGMSSTLGLALANTGTYFPFFSPFLGWIGVFLTGSDTSSNALFGKLQQVTADQIDVNPVLTVAANTSGGGTGKMISPQSIAVGTGAVGLVGRESDLFKFTFLHSLIFAGIIGIITYLQAYILSWMLPGM